MKNRMAKMCVATSVLSLSFLLLGCNREVSKSKSTRVSDDGTVRSTEKTVTEAPDGTVTKTQESKTVSPNN